MIKNRENIAKEYYKELINLYNQDNDICRQLSRKAEIIGEERFIKDYPLSILGVVNYRTFWEICKDLGIIKNPFFCEYGKYDDFEKRLYDIISSIIYMGDKSGYTENDIRELFYQYRKYA